MWGIYSLLWDTVYIFLLLYYTLYVLIYLYNVYILYFCIYFQNIHLSIMKYYYNLKQLLSKWYIINIKQSVMIVSREKTGCTLKSIHIWIAILSCNDCIGFTSFKINFLKQQFGSESCSSCCPALYMLCISLSLSLIQIISSAPTMIVARRDTAPTGNKQLNKCSTY